MLEHIFSPGGLISLTTLTLLEIVLGVDNVVFIAIIASKLPLEQQMKARNYGLFLAIIPRVILLFFLSWLMGLKDDLIALNILGYKISMTEKGLILALGGGFLIYKATTEIHQKLAGDQNHNTDGTKKKASFANALLQIIAINIVFSMDSVLTAVGLAKHVEIMILAVVLSSLIMIVFAGNISNFVEKHPTVKMLALSFLLMIGFLLFTEAVVVNGEEIHVPKGYVYFAMGFALFVEMLNLRMQKKHNPIKLRNPYE